MKKNDEQSDLSLLHINAELLLKKKSVNKDAYFPNENSLKRIHELVVYHLYAP